MKFPAEGYFVLWFWQEQLWPFWVGPPMTLPDLLVGGSETLLGRSFKGGGIRLIATDPVNISTLSKIRDICLCVSVLVFSFPTLQAKCATGGAVPRWGWSPVIGLSIFLVYIKIYFRRINSSIYFVWRLPRVVKGLKNFSAEKTPKWIHRSRIFWVFLGPTTRIHPQTTPITYAAFFC